MERTKTITFKRAFRLFLLIILTAVGQTAFAQIEPPPTDSVPGDPGAISVFKVQDMSFGAFLTGNSGGTVIVSPSGTRSVTGTVVALNLGVSYFNAIFEIDAPQGTILSILNGPDATLTGSNGGSMTLTIGAAEPASPITTIVAQPLRTQVNIGATLTVGSAAANPPGTYTGSFSITINVE